MATEAMQKQQQQGGQVETWKPLYAAAWEQAFNEFMFLMAEQYSLELMIEAGGKSVPSPIVKLWRESLKELSPMQMLQGLRGYLDSERGSFKPTPYQIKENAPVATDRPRKVFDPDCPACAGSGFRKVLVDSKIHVGKKAQKVQNCYCERTVYGGFDFRPEPRQLPPTNEEAAVIIDDLAKKLPALKTMGKMPTEKPEMDEQQTARRRDELKRQFAAHQGEKKA
jgi:hypothetical protein